jgi:tryptophan synthase beta chain
LSYLLQDPNGQVQLAHSISAGLDYPGIGPEHAHLYETKRVSYHGVTDEDALKALKKVSSLEGIIPALETAHAFAWLEELMPTTKENEIVLINCSGRGDKDMGTISEALFGGGKQH